jgi:prepilin-type N-terminal cleavage/methylation domain-containing protein
MQFHTSVSKNNSSKPKGFTLIELLMVISIILILAGITFGVSRGAQNAQARAKAKAELALISQSLEQYKSVNGDYPWVNGEPEEFAKALMGWKEFSRSGTSAGSGITYEDKVDVPSSGPRSFIDPEKLSYSGILPSGSNEVPTDLYFTDPWGNEYIYSYRTSASGAWDNFGYVLYSKGSDNSHVEVSRDGILDATLRQNSKNADNIYAGE